MRDPVTAGSPLRSDAVFSRWQLSLAVALAGLAWCLAVPADDNLRCGSRVVSVRAIAAQVAAVCGEPAYVDRWLLDSVYGQYTEDNEVWYYNFGANQLLRLLRFRNGRLLDIDTDGYGFNVLPDGHCSAGDIVLGESKYRLLLSCGEPVARRAGSALRPLRPSNGYEQNTHGLHDGGFTPIYREELTYNFGSGARLRTATLENGWVVDITDGDRGFDPP